MKYHRIFYHLSPDVFCQFVLKFKEFVQMQAACAARSIQIVLQIVVLCLFFRFNLWFSPKNLHFFAGASGILCKNLLYWYLN